MPKKKWAVPHSYLMNPSTNGSGVVCEPSSLYGSARGSKSVNGGSRLSVAPVHDGPVAKTSQRNPKRRPRSVLRDILNSAT